MPDALPAPLRARRRRARVVYAAVVGVVVLAAATVFGVVVATGEAANATLTTSAAAAPVPAGTIPTSLTARWSTTDRPAQGDPLWVGTVVTSSAHQLSGRDAASGAVRWSYRRDDATVCDAGQIAGQAIVLWRKDGNCDQINGFDAQTGARKWFRTLADDGDGRILFGTAGVVLAYPTSIHALDPYGSTPGLERFSAAVQQASCLITGVAPGSGGILVSEQCDDGAHLALYDNNGVQGAPSQKWRVDVGDAVRAVAADLGAAFSVDTATGTVTARSLDRGAELGPVALDPTTPGSPGPTLTTSSEAVLTLGTRLFGVSPAYAQVWTAGDAIGPAAPVDDAVSALLTATPDGAQRLDPATGDLTATYGFTGTAAGSRVYPAGVGLLLADDDPAAGQPGLTYLR